jgi:hypothetical protein
MTIAHSQAPSPCKSPRVVSRRAEKAAPSEKSLAGNFGFGTKLTNRVVRYDLDGKANPR